MKFPEAKLAVGRSYEGNNYIVAVERSRKPEKSPEISGRCKIPDVDCLDCDVVLCLARPAEKLI